MSYRVPLEIAPARRQARGRRPDAVPGHRRGGRASTSHLSARSASRISSSIRRRGPQGRAHAHRALRPATCVPKSSGLPASGHAACRRALPEPVAGFISRGRGWAASAPRMPPAIPWWCPSATPGTAEALFSAIDAKPKRAAAGELRASGTSGPTRGRVRHRRVRRGLDSPALGHHPGPGRDPHRRAGLPARHRAPPRQVPAVPPLGTAAASRAP